jgi:peptide deformylase
MAVRPIVTNPDAPEVRGRAKRVSRIDDTIRALLDDMVDTMRVAPGVGLAAPQIGVPLRLIVVEYEGQLFRVVNPELSKMAGAETDEEGCLSVPNWQGPVTRATSIFVKGRDRDGREFRLAADGWLARIFQHECDHLDGTLFIDRVTDRAALHWIDPEDVLEEAEGGKRRRKRSSGSTSPASEA